MMKSFELNCDLGESAGNDDQIMPFLDACSIACGGHTGDEASMEVAVELAKKWKVKVGAHPSFPDRENFGRVVMDITNESLLESLFSQMDSLERICREKHVSLDHIKPHGALYNLAGTDEDTAKVIVESMRKYPDLHLLAPWNSKLADIAEKRNVRIRYEAFADRRYTSTGSLVSRTNADAVIKDERNAIRQVLSIVNNSRVTSIDGESIRLKAETFCIHGDNPGAVAIARALSEVRDAKS